MIQEVDGKVMNPICYGKIYRVAPTKMELAQIMR